MICVHSHLSLKIRQLSQLAFFIDYLKQRGLFGAWVTDCPFWPPLRFRTA